MARAELHSTLIAAAGRTVLRPMGVYRKGRSRLWIDDHRWWICNVEFQPSGFDKGSYLNVGVQWLWKRFAAHAFMVNEGPKPWVRFDSEEQFAPEADRLARLAAEQVERYRQLFPSVRAVAHYYMLLAGGHDANAARRLPPALRFYGAVALGMTGQDRLADSWFESYLSFDDPAPQPWALADREEARALAELTHDPRMFREAIERTIASTRSALNLSASDPPFLPAN